MALSQVQCLDDNHINARIHESKPEFLYCEDQRLALESLLRDGREAFFKYLQDRGLRGFLSDLELETLTEAVEPYDPNTEIFPESAEDGEPPLSLRYWPEVSDTTIPQMDIGWPDSDAYRGVTRTTVHTQPPLDGQTHIKEVVRKMIAQAQKVIAVVMDVFTDVDIFRDMLDISFKKKVAVYILLESTSLPHFLSMCQRANMHAGHLKHLRVRCTDGPEFYTRSSTKVRGKLGHRFMFIDGDKAVSGSYSFTWMSSRLERNLITVITGQAVDTFDRLFRFLYASSRPVNVQQVATEPEPEPEPLPQPATVAPLSAAVARKLYSPKYALVVASNHSPTSSTGNNGSKEPNSDSPKNPEVPGPKNRRRKRGSKDIMQEAPPLHPGLVDLEKACLISYLPTWPEPDPPSDVIGFINIRDANRPNQVHLQRSEMFETSQAIRFSSPFSIPKENLPEVAKPRQITAKHDYMNKLNKEVEIVQPTQVNTEPGDVKIKREAPYHKPSTPESEKHATKALNTENKQQSQTLANHNPTSHQNTHTSSQYNINTDNIKSAVDTVQPSHITQTVTMDSPKPQILPEPNAKKGETSLNRESDVMCKKHTLNLSDPTDSNSKSELKQTNTKLPQKDAYTRYVNAQLHNSSETTPDKQIPASHSHVSSPQSISSPSLSEKNHIPNSTVDSRTGIDVYTSVSFTTCSSSLPPPISSSTNTNRPFPSSSTSTPLTATPPVPKPRTVQLVIRDDGTSTSQKLPEISVVKRQESLSSVEPPMIHSEPDVAKVVRTPPPEKKTEISLQEQNSGSRMVEKDPESSENLEEDPQQKQNVTFQKVEVEETVRLHDHSTAAVQMDAEAKPQDQSDVLITDALKADGMNIQGIIPKEVEPESKVSTEYKVSGCVATVETHTEATKKSLTVPSEESENAIQHKIFHARAEEPQRISYCEVNPADLDVSETVEASANASVCATTKSHLSKDNGDDSTNSQQDNPSVTSLHYTHSEPDTVAYNKRINVTSQKSQQIPKAPGCSHTPERPLRLHFSDTHIPDFRSPTAEWQSRSLANVARTPTPDVFLPVTPNSDSRTQTPDSRSYTPDFRTPEPDVSDEYLSPRDDSNLSTTSEEFYECTDSPSPDTGADSLDVINHRTTADHESFALTNTPTVTATAASDPAYTNCSTMFENKDSETQSLSGTARVDTASYLIEEVKMGEKKEASNEENGTQDEEEIWIKRGSQGTERRGSDEANETTQVVEAQQQAPKRKRVLNQSAAERLFDRGVTQPDRSQSARDGDRLKFSRGQQQSSGPPSPSRKPRPTRPFSTTQLLEARPDGGRQLIQTESKGLHGSFQVSDNTFSPRKPAARPSPALETGQKQFEFSNSQQSVSSRQPVTAQSKARPGQSQNQHPYPKPQASFLHTHSNVQQLQPQPHFPNQTVSTQETHRQEEGRVPFSFTFGKLYSLKDLKDKVNKLPAQSKKSSTSSSPQRRTKSSS